MRMRSRMLPVAAALGLAFIASACGDGGTEESDTAADPETADADDGADSAAGEVLTVWHYYSNENQVELMDAYATRFEEAQSGVTVDNVYVPYDQMNSNVINAAGAGEGPDVMVFNGAESNVLALAGAVIPLNDYWDSYADAGQFPEGVLHDFDGELMAIQSYVNLLGLWYNADLLEEVGHEPPTNIDELETAMAAAVDAGHQGITLTGLPQSQGEFQAYPWLTSQGFTYENLDEDALAQALRMVRNWIDEGYLSQEAVTWDQTVPFQEFSAGGVAFTANGNWHVTAAEEDADFEYGVVPLPVAPEGRVYLGGEGQAIGVNSQNPDLAWSYLEETFLNPEGQLEALDLVGSIPAREDASQDAAVSESEILEPFSETVNQLGATYPEPGIPAEVVADMTTTVAQAWSAVIGDQQSPEDAASQAIQRLEGLRAN